MPLPLTSRPAVEARIRAALDSARALLRLEDCELRLVDFDAGSGEARLEVAGGCPHCELSVATFGMAVEAHVQQSVPEVRAVRLVQR